MELKVLKDGDSKNVGVHLVSCLRVYSVPDGWSSHSLTVTRREDAEKMIDCEECKKIISLQS